MSSHYSRREDDGAVVFHVVPAPYPTGSKVNKNGARTMFMGMILSVPMVFVFFIGIPYVLRMLQGLTVHSEKTRRNQSCRRLPESRSI